METWKVSSPDPTVALKTRGTDPAFTDSTDAETQIKSHWAQKGVRVTLIDQPIGSMFSI